MPNSSQLPDQDDSLSSRVIGDQVRLLAISQLDQRLERYRLAQPKLEQQMLKSLRDYGQLSPVVVCQLDGQTVLVDGFKRLRAARTLKGSHQLMGRFLEADEQAAKAAIFNLNRITSRPVELEEAWIIYALVIDDGLQQVEVAQMLGRHKSWVNRRLALIERLCDEAREALRLGLLTPTQARHLTRLPRGNQLSAMQSATHAALTSRELSDMVDLLLASSTQEQTQLVLEKPRQAISQSQDHHVHHWDSRLSAAGNRLAKRLGFLLDSLSKMNTWLRFEGRGQLQACDRVPLVPGFNKLQQEATLLIEANDDSVPQAKTHEPVPPSLGCPTAKRASKLDAFEPQLLQLIERYPNITNVRLYEEIQASGYTGRYSILAERVRQLRDRPTKPLTVRFETGPGVQAQMDWSTYEIDFMQEGRRKVQLFSYILGYSRRQYIHFTERQDFETASRS